MIQQVINNQLPGKYKNMKKLIALTILVLFVTIVYSQEHVKKYIFMGHPRSDDRTGEYLLPTIEKVDFTKYELLLLGGDLTWSTSEKRSTLEYCDFYFHFSSDSLHWALGNHDLANLTLLQEFRAKPRYYAFTQNNITFLILDTDISKPNISGDQLQMIKNVTDTINDSDHLILVHHRILWMANNDSLSYLLDSVAASSQNLNATNFFTDVYPLLQKAKNKGVDVLCIAGDRTNVNIEYSSEDSIQFIASGLVGTFPDNNNFVVILTHNIDTRELNYEFVSIDKLDTIGSSGTTENRVFDSSISSHDRISIYPNPSNGQLNIKFSQIQEFNVEIEVLDLFGNSVLKKLYGYNSEIKLDLTGYRNGIYLLKVKTNKKTFVEKISIQ